MAMRATAAVNEGVRTLLQWGALGSRTDAQLVGLFLAGSEAREAAFRAVLTRHGPMVLGVCRRVLGDDHAAEDAFQATFLVFVRKAGSLREGDLLGNWLYGVALRVARKAKAGEARRRVVERDAGAQTDLLDMATAAEADLHAAIDEEIRRLPERYRAPVILCYLEGLKHDEAARRLGCPVGTVESRLSRARERLRTRLTRRGLAPTASVLALALAPSPASAVTDRLIATTVGAALRTVPTAAFAVLSVSSGVGLGSALYAGVLSTTLLVAACILAVGHDLSRGIRSALSRDSSPQGVSPPPSKSALPHRSSQTGETPRRPSTLKPALDRSAFAYARPLSGIRIDGHLDDWPAGLERYPIANLLLGHPSYDESDRAAREERDAFFQVGYDRASGRIFLAAVVRDDDLVVAGEGTLRTDAVEVYLDATASNRAIPLPKGNWTSELHAARMPVLQYAAVPGPVPVYDNPQRANPALMYGDIRATTTAMSHSRDGDLTIYEWALQPFDQYPGRPAELRPGKRLGLEVAIVDKDAARSRPAFLTWGAPPRIFKGCDAASLGELILLGGP
jgi:RNA polymerase sigma factor (sigma-70 family)